jgi:hypothetical protein
MMEAVRTSETSVDNHSTRQYNPEDSSEQNYKSFNEMSSYVILSLWLATLDSTLVYFEISTAKGGSNTQNKFLSLST